MLTAKEVNKSILKDVRKGTQISLATDVRGKRRVWADGKKLIGFPIAQDYEGQPWSQGLLSQYDVKKLQDIFEVLQIANC